MTFLLLAVSGKTVAFNICVWFKSIFILCSLKSTADTLSVASFLTWESISKLIFLTRELLT